MGTPADDLEGKGATPDATAGAMAEATVGAGAGAKEGGAGAPAARATLTKGEAAGSSEERKLAGRVGRPTPPPCPTCALGITERTAASFCATCSGDRPARIEPSSGKLGGGRGTAGGASAPQGRVPPQCDGARELGAQLGSGLSRALEWAHVKRLSAAVA